MSIQTVANWRNGYRAKGLAILKGAPRPGRPVAIAGGQRAQVTDLDGNSEERGNAISVFNGPPPLIHTLASQEDEIRTASAWLAERLQSGLQPHEIGVFVRSAAELARAQAAVQQAGVPFKVLDEQVATL